MNDERPEGDETHRLVISAPAQGAGGFVVPMEPLKVGPGEPGPGDEWHFGGAVPQPSDSDQEPSEPLPNAE